MTGHASDPGAAPGGSGRHPRAPAGALALALCVLALPARALDPALAVTQYQQRAWLADHGLPQNTVFSILQTRDGYLWLATQEGLARFDGVRFAVFNKRNTPALGHNDILTLLEDRAGTLWIGTRGGGLTRYRDGAFVNDSRERGLAHESVQALLEDRAGALWIGTRGGGLFRFHAGAFTAYTTKDGLAGDTIYALAEDRAGRLWIGTDGGGLSRLEQGVFTTYTTRQGLPNDTVYALHEGRGGELWIGTGAGLVRRADDRFTAYRASAGSPGDVVRAILEDRDGNLWVGTDGGGLSRFRDGRFETLARSHGLSNDNIAAIYEDREGNLWVGTDAGGVNRLRNTPFVPFGSAEGLSNDNARAILEDRDGSLWIGTFGGLDRVSGGKVERFTTAQGLSSNIILSMAQDRAGDLWLGTINGGLNRLRDGKVTVFSRAHGLTNDTVLSVHVDAAGTLWAGTRSGGLHRFEHGRFRAFTTEHGLSSNDIRAIVDRRAGGLWLGTRGGITRFENGVAKAYSTRDGLSNDTVFSLHEDADGALWIGTYGGGLNRFKDGRFTAYTTAEGLFDDVVYQILEDGHGNLWMSSNHGVFRVARKMLDDFAEGRIRAIESTAYGRSDGLRNNESNGGHQPAGTRTRDGRLWFPTIQGVAAVDPQRLLAAPPAPPVLIESAMADAKPVDPRQPAELPPGSNKLEFHYTALDYGAPERVRFQYRLEGFDRDWVEAGALRSAYYTNIPPGEYRFLVRASAGGPWNEAAAALPFRLQPYFWQRRAFPLVYVLAVVSVFALGVRRYRVRVRRLKARERELLRLVEERRRAEEALVALNAKLEQRAAELSRSNAALENFVHVASHDLKEPLRAVVSFTQLLARKYRGRIDSEADTYIDYAVEGACSMRTRIDNLLAYSSLGRFEAVDTEGKALLEQALHGLAGALEKSGAVVTHDPLPVIRMHPGEAVQLFHHLIDNAIKFRGDAPPRIHVGAARSPDGPAWVFSVTDNGIGIDPQHGDRIFGLFQRLHHREEYGGTGVGLSLCRKIVEGRGGRIWVEPAPGQGSRFCFSIPDPPDAAPPDSAAA